MAELKVRIPEGLDRIIGSELDKPETKALLEEAVEEKLKIIVLSTVVDSILSKSKLTDGKFEELVKEYRKGLAKAHGV